MGRSLLNSNTLERAIFGAGRTEETVNEHGIVVGEGKMTTPLPPQVITTSGKFVVPSITSDEDALRQMMEEQTRGSSGRTFAKLKNLDKLS